MSHPPVEPPPLAERRPVREQLYRHEVVDDYRWLEGDEAGKPTEEVTAWTEQQNARTRVVLDNLPGRQELEDRLRPLMEIGWVGTPVARRDRYFYLERTGKQEQPILYLLEEVDGQPRVLLDPMELDPSGRTSLDWYEPDPTGQLVAIGTSVEGDENYTLEILRVDDGQWLADVIPNKVGGVDWLPDGCTFLYTQLRDVKDPYSRLIRLHRVGRHHRHDPILVEQEGTTWGPFAYLSPDARWMVLGEYQGTDRNDLWVVDFDQYLRSGRLERIPIVVGEAALSQGAVRGDTLYLKTNLDAPKGRVVAVDLHRPEAEHWVDVLPERPDAVLEASQVARGVIVGTYLCRASTRIERFRMNGEPLGALELPGLGTAWVRTQHDRTEGFLAFTTFHQPREIHRIDLVTGQRTLWRKQRLEADVEGVCVEQVEVPSNDGTLITMFLIRPEDAAPGGNHPVVLNGYGGFNSSITPGFRSSLLPWLEDGGILALPNLRGGGEYGAEWHRAGMLESKQNTFDDFIACAEWLMAEGWTTSERLAISGGSNGGLLVGAAMTQRPELFRAVVCAVPLLDMLRYHLFLMARFWVPEYGSAEEEEQLEWLRAYSPYHRVEAGQDYPAIFLTAGEHDTRVHPLHARKMAARLQALEGAHPVLLWVEMEAGHGAGKPFSLQVQELVDREMFVRWQLEML